MVAVPKILACFGGGEVVQMTDSTSIECTSIGWAGPWSWYSSCPWGLFCESTLAFPPKLPLSPLLAVIHPP